MKHMTSTMAVALLAAAGLGGTALAQDRAATTGNADKTQVVPKKEDLTPRKPSAEVLDDNTQRAHDRDRGATGTRQGQNRQADQQVAAGGVRDWSEIDANNDNLIQPDEMEAALKEVGPQAKQTK